MSPLTNLVPVNALPKVKMHQSPIPAQNVPSTSPERTVQLVVIGFEEKAAQIVEQDFRATSAVLSSLAVSIVVIVRLTSLHFLIATLA